LRNLTCFALGLLAFFCLGARARASTEVWCAFGVHYLAPAHSDVAADDLYDLAFENASGATVTHVRLDLMDDTRIYEIDVPVRNPRKYSGEAAMTAYDPVAVHFSKPLAIRNAWIKAIGDDDGHAASCYPLPAGITHYKNAEEDERTRAEVRSMPHVEFLAGDGTPFITPDGCTNRFVDASAYDVVTPGVPFEGRMALTMAGEVTALIKVDLAQDGELVRATVLRSSGIPSLDAAALAAASATKYHPKKINCIPFASTYTFRSTFSANAL